MYYFRTNACSSLVILAMEMLICCSSNAEESHYDLYEDFNPIEVEKLSILPPRLVERMVLPIKTTGFYSTALDCGHQSLPPWDEGNHLSLFLTRAIPTGYHRVADSWSIVNIHSENFSLITEALEMDTIEVVVLHNKSDNESNQSGKSGRLEKPFTNKATYVIVTDARIPRKWFRLEPSIQRDEETRSILVKTFPKSFRKHKKSDNKPEKELELKLSHGDDPWPKLTIPGYSLYPDESNE